MQTLAGLDWQKKKKTMDKNHLLTFYLTFLFLLNLFIALSLSLSHLLPMPTQVLTESLDALQKCCFPQ